MSSQAARGQRDIMLIHKRDHLELRETLQNIIANTGELKDLLGMRSPAAVEEVMQSIQEVK